MVAMWMLVSSSTGVHAAGGAYAVDDAVIGKPGDCQVETWASFAGIKGFIGTAQPACVLQFGVPVELTAILQRTRAGEDWATNVGAQAKSILAPIALGQLGIAVTAGATFNVMTGQDATSFVNVPMSFKLHDLVQLNANVGWLHSEDHHLTWGAGLEWEFRKPWTLLAEVFGETGKMDHPRGQVGLRYTPLETIDIDIVLGHNIAGEAAQWLTGGVTLRF